MPSFLIHTVLTSFIRGWHLPPLIYTVLTSPSSHLCSANFLLLSFIQCWLLPPFIHTVLTFFSSHLCRADISIPSFVQCWHLPPLIHAVMTSSFSHFLFSAGIYLIHKVLTHSSSHSYNDGIFLLSFMQCWHLSMLIRNELICPSLSHSGMAFLTSP